LLALENNIIITDDIKKLVIKKFIKVKPSGINIK
jgi:hypothetical protein